MTKAEFVDQVADRSGLARERPARRRRRPGHHQGGLVAWRRDQLHRLRQVRRGRSWCPPGSEPADRRADPDRREPRAALQRGLAPEEAPSRAASRGGCISPTGSRRSSTSAAAASCSGSTQIPRRCGQGGPATPARAARRARATAEAVAEHCRAAIVAAGPACVAVKLAARLLRAPRRPRAGRRSSATAAIARDHGLLVIADGKRGDVPVTAAAYAQALVGETPGPYGPVPGLGADAFTANPLLGRDALEPLLEAARPPGPGCFVLVRTSNPGRGRAPGRGRRRRSTSGSRAWSTTSAAGATRRLRALAGRARSPARPSPELLARLRELMPRASSCCPASARRAAGWRTWPRPSRPIPPPGSSRPRARSWVPTGARRRSRARRGRRGRGAARGRVERSPPECLTCAYWEPDAPDRPSQPRSPSSSARAGGRRARGRARRGSRRGKRRRRRWRRRPPRTAPEPRPTPPPRPRRPPRRRTYTVKTGDTLGLIAEKTGVSVERLQELNPELDPQALLSGQKITLRE